MDRSFLSIVSLLASGVCALTTACSDESSTAPSACDGGMCAGPLDSGSDGAQPMQPNPDGGSPLDGSMPLPDGGHSDASSNSDASASDDAGDDGGVTWPTGPIRPTRYRIDDPSYATPPCAASGDGTLSAHQALLGQTHLTPAGWPFQTVSANRPLTVAASVAGTGAAPALTATARLNGEELTICLSGASALPADASDFAASLYRGVLPAEWVAPGLEVEISGGGWSETLAPDVKAESGLTVYLVHAQLFGEGVNDETSDAQLRELLVRLPVSYLDVGVDPFGVWSPAKLLISPRDDGRLPNGDATTHDAIVIDQNPHCSDDDKANGTCTLCSGYGVMAGVLDTLDTFREANGVNGTSTWYADLAVELGGGLAGGQRGTGDNTMLVMNHELGHAWGFPHWGAGNTEYPYEGVQRDRGGFGDRWAIDQVRDLLLSPICADLERQSPMQRAGSCVPDGSWFDPYSDYEAARLLRMTLGAEAEITGTVAYSGGTQGGATRSFRLQAESGRPLMIWNDGAPGMTLHHYVEATNGFEAFTPERWNRIASAEVPVTMFAGAVIVSGQSFFEAPIDYVGNVLEPLDPTDAEDYAYLYEHRSSDFYWASDLVLRFTLDDGTVLSRMYGAEAVLREPGDHERFAFNLPRALGERVVKLEVISRPLGQYSEDSRLDDADSAATYLDGSTVLATWDR